MAKTKVLKVTKSDKTVHIVPLANKTFYQHLNNRILNDSEKWKLEEITEEEAANVPFIDETFVTAAEAPRKISELEAQIEELRKLQADMEEGGAKILSAKDQEIEHLRHQLSLKSDAIVTGTVAGADTASESVPFAAETPVISEQTTEQFNDSLKEASIKETPKRHRGN